MPPRVKRDSRVLIVHVDTQHNFEWKKQNRSRDNYFYRYTILERQINLKYNFNQVNQTKMLLKSQ